MSQSQFDDPYKDVPDEHKSRLNSDVATEDYRFLQRIRIQRGTIQTTVNILLKKLIDELKRRNITDFAQCGAFEHFVRACRLTDDGEAEPARGPRSASTRPRTKASQRDDRTGDA